MSKWTTHAMGAADFTSRRAANADTIAAALAALEKRIAALEAAAQGGDEGPADDDSEPPPAAARAMRLPPEEKAALDRRMGIQSGREPRVLRVGRTVSFSTVR